MTVIDFLRLLRKHIVLLIFTPVVLAVLVIFLTRNPSYTYSSETALYTGIASGSSVEMDKSFSYYANNTAFDNLINVIGSRQTQQEVAIRLLAQHLMLDSYDPKYISKQSFLQLQRITPAAIRKLIHKNGTAHTSVSAADTLKTPEDVQGVDTMLLNSKFSFDDLDSSNSLQMQPASIDKDAFEQTVKNLEAYMNSSDTNFVYKLLYFEDPHYSIKAISGIKVTRIATSDLVKLKFDTDDPGICQQTLALMTEVCMKNYKLIKENRSDAVVKYFEFQLRQAAARLKVGEDKLLKFNEDNNIINYYEQSKAVAVVKEDLDVDYNNKRIKLAGYQAAIKRIEEKLGNQQHIQLGSSSLVEKRNQLGDIDARIATAEIINYGKTVDDAKLAKLKQDSERLKEEIRNQVNELYGYGNSTEGLPVSTLLNDWISNVINYEDTKAGLEVLGDRIKEFQKQYAVYAPAGANIKRIEREISVSEQEFLEILHGLNLAKLKMQDAELSSSIKIVDPPFYPLSPNPTKRKVLVLAAAMVGLLLVLSAIFATEYFDETLRNAGKAAKIIKLKAIGVFPKVFLKTGTLNFPFVTNRVLELIIQQIDLLTVRNTVSSEPKTILFISSVKSEGKTVLAQNIAWKLKNMGRKVLFLNYSGESVRHNEKSQIGYPPDPGTSAGKGKKYSPWRFRFISRMLGYTDTRIDPSSPFLQSPEEILGSHEYVEYRIGANYFSSENFSDLMGSGSFSPELHPDYVLIELPSLLYTSFPTQLIASADLPILVCRANRVWTAADQGVLDTLRMMSAQEPVMVLNGVDLDAVESVLGDLPKKRSRLRRIIKNAVRLQFYSRHQP
jgi:polysaccharide biosynthesis transport protein